MNRASDWQAALRLVWFTLSALVLGILLTPYVLSAEQIARITPVCQSKARYHRECAFCGMTTAFIGLSHGRFSEAERANQGSAPLYAAFAVNELVLFGYLAVRSGRHC